MNKKWKRWNRGWGESLVLADELKLSASKGMSKGDGFSFNVFGLRSKRQFDKIEDAKFEAERVANILLKKALEALNE